MRASLYSHLPNWLAVRVRELSVEPFILLPSCATHQRLRGLTLHSVEPNRWPGKGKKKPTGYNIRTSLGCAVGSEPLEMEHCQHGCLSSHANVYRSISRRAHRMNGLERGDDLGLEMGCVCYTEVE